MANVLISTPHPVTLEGQNRIECDLHPGESLFSFLHRHVPDISERPYTVLIGGVEVPMEYWTRVRPKHGQVIEAIGGVGRSALAMVAVIALSIWTGGALSALASGGTVFGLTGIAGYAAVLAVNVGAALLINKVLAPKLSDTSPQQASAVSSLTGSQNRFRPNEPAGLLFGTARIAPDQLSKPYNYYEKDEMYLALHLSWGIGVDTIDELYMGDTLLADYSSDVTVWHSGFTGIADQQIPLFGNVDTITGGALQDDDGNLTPVERTTSLNTTRIQWDISIQLFDVTSSGKPKENQERIDCYIRPAGSSDPWVLAGTQTIKSKTNREHRFSIIATVPEGQYDTRTARAGIDTGIENAQCRAALATLTSVQKDEATYKGIARSGFQMRASSQLNSTPNEIRAVAHSTPIPLWTGTEWVLASTGNVGANMLKYLRGYYDEDNNLIAGIGYTDDLIDIEAFKAYMVHCTAMGYEYNHWLQQDRDHITQLNTMASAGLGQYSDAGGLASVMWIAEDQPEDAIVNMARIAKDDFQLDYALVGTADGVVVKFVDATTWEDDEIRIPMPGQTTMLNPATIEAEGVTDIDVAGMIGRYFLAQSLYQYKDISFGTTLEYLSYRRWSKIKLQFDMTQWGYGGVIVHAEQQPGGNLVLELDEPVPYPDTGGGYIGIRVPGQRMYQVFPVEPFIGTTKMLTLVGEWPAGLAVPGDTPQNPAHDSLWIYDFKSTPGLTARVTAITPKNGYTGATVSVVPESDEFWNYVINGIYIPSPNGSLLRTRPRVTSLVVTEERVVIDNVVQHQLTASYDIEGPCGHVVVTSDVDSPGFMQIVGETITGRSVSWVIDENRAYTITVRPYSPQGLAGIPATLIYNVGGVGTPPPIFDYFNVEEVDGGLRRYSWGYNADSTPVNIAGAEIRIVEGTVTNPNWDLIDPLGEGFYTADFESTLPASGEWTFVIRARDTAGNLSIDRIVLSKVLGMTLQETIDSIGGDGMLPVENPSFEVNEGWGRYNLTGGPGVYVDGITEAGFSRSGLSRTGNYSIYRTSRTGAAIELFSRCDNAVDFQNINEKRYKYLRFIEPSDVIELSLYSADEYALSVNEVSGAAVLSLICVAFDPVTGEWDGQYRQSPYATASSTWTSGMQEPLRIGGSNFGNRALNRFGANQVTSLNPSKKWAIHSLRIVSNAPSPLAAPRTIIDDVELKIIKVGEVATANVAYDKDMVPVPYSSSWGGGTGSIGYVAPSYRTFEYGDYFPGRGFTATIPYGMSVTRGMMKFRQSIAGAAPYYYMDFGLVRLSPEQYIPSYFLRAYPDPNSSAAKLIGNILEIAPDASIKQTDANDAARVIRTHKGCTYVTLGGHIICMGSKFGTSGKLMFYVGPGSDPATVDPANAFIYYDSDGNHS